MGKKKKIKKPKKKEAKQIDLLGPEANHSFCNNLGALFKQRTNHYRRERKILAYELLVPMLILLSGVILTKFEWFDRS